MSIQVYVFIRVSVFKINLLHFTPSPPFNPSLSDPVWRAIAGKRDSNTASFIPTPAARHGFERLGRFYSTFPQSLLATDTP